MRTDRQPWLSSAAARAMAQQVGQEQSQVVSRRQLVHARVPRWVIRAEIAAGRWQSSYCQTVVLHNGPLSVDERRWVALLGTGRRAALDGVTALQAAGAKGLTDTIVHVITPRGSEPPRMPGVVIHESRRFREEDVVSGGIRRVRPAVAAVHAALWARSVRQAQLYLLICVQQRLAPVELVAVAVDGVRRHPRRRLLRRLVADMAAGVQSLGELDVAEDFRRRGLPEPERQCVRKRPSGTQYLDCRLPKYRLVLEIDGAGHEQPEQQLADFLRDLDVAADGDTVVRIPLSLYRLARGQVLDRVAALLVVRGWKPAAGAAA